MWLFALLVGIPILEIALFIQVGGWLGLWPTLGIVVLTAVAGTFLLRTQGVQTLGRLQYNVAQGQNPMDPIAHGALILVSAVLLLTPGFFTDALGLTLLIPPVRQFLIQIGANKVAAGKFVHVQGQFHEPQRPGSEHETVDGVYDVLDEDEVEGKPTRSGWSKNLDR